MGQLGGSIVTQMKLIFGERTFRRKGHDQLW